MKVQLVSMLRLVGRLKNFRNFTKALLAVLVYGYPARKLFVIGVSGTDGKTTTSHLLYEILKAAGYKVGLISTLGVFVDNKRLDTGLHTTMPEPFSMQKILKMLKDKGVSHVVLEVTSHGIDQHRALGCNFKVGVLTNITYEHTDYHRSFENYRKVKTRLFQSVKIAVLNKDDRSYRYIKDRVSPTTYIVDYSLTKRAKLQAVGIKLLPTGMSFKVKEEERLFSLSSKLIGDYNVSNILAAAGAVRKLGVDWRQIRRAISEFPGIEGRMEIVDEGQDFQIIVDFAHTPNSLEKVLTALKRVTNRKLIAAFGSAGERDVAKRWMMAEISGRLADYTILTAEDPRSEDVNKILDDMEKGVKKTRGKYFKIPTRGEAIAFAIQKLAKREDTVVILGKGHEKSMAYNGVEYPWSDQEAVRIALRGGVKDLKLK